MEYIFTFTNDKSLHQKYFQLRQFVNEKYFQVGLKLTDEWDANSYICVVLKDDLVIAGCRLTIYEGDLLPMETENFRITSEYKPLQIAELSKLVVHPDFSKDNIAQRLFKEVEKKAKLLQIKYVYSIVANKQARLYSIYFNRYKRKDMGDSVFEIIDDINITNCVKQKYERQVSCLTRVKIG